MKLKPEYAKLTVNNLIYVEGEEDEWPGKCRMTWKYFCILNSLRQFHRELCFTLPAT